MADGNVIHFNKADYDKLIQILNADIDEVDRSFLSHTLELRLDEALGDDVKPGAPKWRPVEKIYKAANGFGGSVRKELLGLIDDWEEFVKALKGAVDVFQSNADLATMSAQDFLDKYPDFGSR